MKISKGISFSFTTPPYTFIDLELNWLDLNEDVRNEILSMVDELYPEENHFQFPVVNVSFCVYGATKHETEQNDSRGC